MSGHVAARHPLAPDTIGGGERRRAVAGDGLLQPVVVGSIVVLLVNDQILKRAWPGIVSGKLSLPRSSRARAAGGGRPAGAG